MANTGIVKYGQVRGIVVSKEYGIAASETFKDLSGCFVQVNSSGYVAVSGTDTATDIMGWAYSGAFTSSSTAGQSRVTVNLAKDATYLMPLQAAYTESQLIGYLGKFMDIAVSSNIQYANPGGTSVNIIRAVGYRYWGSAAGQQALEVQLVGKTVTTQA